MHFYSLSSVTIISDTCHSLWGTGQVGSEPQRDDEQTSRDEMLIADGNPALQQEILDRHLGSRKAAAVEYTVEVALRSLNGVEADFQSCKRAVQKAANQNGGVFANETVNSASNAEKGLAAVFANFGLDWGGAPKRNDIHVMSFVFSPAE